MVLENESVSSAPHLTLSHAVGFRMKESECQNTRQKFDDCVRHLNPQNVPPIMIPDVFGMNDWTTQDVFLYKEP